MQNVTDWLAGLESLPGELLAAARRNNDPDDCHRRARNALPVLRKMVEAACRYSNAIEMVMQRILDESEKA